MTTRSLFILVTARSVRILLECFLAFGLCDINHPPTKLQEGNVFIRVCLYIGKGGPHVTITHGALDLTVQPLPQT